MESLRLIDWFTYLYNFSLDNAVTSLDIDPSGEFMSTMDFYGINSISDINTNNPIFCLEMDIINGNGN